VLDGEMLNGGMLNGGMLNGGMLNGEMLNGGMLNGGMLKAVILGFNGIVINDEDIHRSLIESLLLEENLLFDSAEYRRMCLGRSDRACLKALLTARGRLVAEDTLQRLAHKKGLAYQHWLATVEKLPLYAGIQDLVFRAKVAQYPLAIATGAQREEVETVLQFAGLMDAFTVIVTGDELTTDTSKPDPDCYLQAYSQLSAQFPELKLQPADCVAIEDSFVGIDAAKAAGIPVIGVAHTYPYHMMQRCANWAVDYLAEIDFEWIRQRYEGTLPAEQVLL
jgi:beta-phosphoglucomutase